jgi:hypothetical protein
LTVIYEIAANLTPISGIEHGCCVAQKRILGYDRRGFPTGRSANRGFESRLNRRVFHVLFQFSAEGAAPALARSLIPHSPRPPPVSKQATTNNCQHQQRGAIDELHAEPGPSENLTPT